MNKALRNQLQKIVKDLYASGYSQSDKDRAEIGAYQRLIDLITAREEQLYFKLEDKLHKEYLDFDNEMDASSAFAQAIAIAKEVFNIQLIREGDKPHKIEYCGALVKAEEQNGELVDTCIECGREKKDEKKNNKS